MPAEEPAAPPAPAEVEAAAPEPEIAPPPEPEEEISLEAILEDLKRREGRAD